MLFRWHKAKRNMNYLFIGTILLTIIDRRDAQQLQMQAKKFINLNHNKDFLNIFKENDERNLFYQDVNDIESSEEYDSKELSPIQQILQHFTINTKSENKWQKVNQTNNTNIKDSSKKNQRLCEKKYAEYIEQIFPNEKDTVADANDSQFNGRILADPGEYPHMCALGFRNNMNGEVIYKCGGSLISDKFVITAAHCADLNGEKPSKIRIGAVNLMSNHTKPLIRNVKAVFIHSDYKATSNYNDIALLEVDKEIKLTKNIRPIRLWTSATIAFKEAYAMGYGSTAFAREPTNCLTVLTMTIVPNVECDRKMPILPETKNGIISSQICAQDFISNRDTCQGDSGGPLQLNLYGHRHHERLHYHLIGITSYGLYCRSGYPSVFTRVQYYLDWIEQIVWR